MLYYRYRINFTHIFWKKLLGNEAQSIIDYIFLAALIFLIIVLNFRSLLPLVKEGIQQYFVKKEGTVSVDGAVQLADFDPAGCGNQTCDIGEHCENCQTDCGVCLEPCSAPETSWGGHCSGALPTPVPHGTIALVKNVNEGYKGEIRYLQCRNRVWRLVSPSVMSCQPQ